MDKLTINNIHKHYEDAPLLTGVNLSIQSGEILCLLGRSGSGKSTLLRIVAGLEHSEQGEICWNGQNLEGVPAHLRYFGMMFQDYALFPHRNVAENVAFGLEMKKQPQKEIAALVNEALSNVNMAGFALRSIAELSGGEQQRVALARALAARPRLLMLDEPLAALDRSLRLDLQKELSEHLHEAGIPVIYVTHDQEEAVALGDRMAILTGGKIVQNGTPRQVFETPANRLVAEFLGMKNFLEGRVESSEPIVVSTVLGEFSVDQSDHAVTTGSSVTLIIPTENCLKAESQPLNNSIQGRVSTCDFRRDGFLITVLTAADSIFEFLVKEEVQIGFLITLHVPPTSIKVMKG
jgi:ABC-type Fe3+/spermidine/putrescine transport system ATPase subunit